MLVLHPWRSLSLPALGYSMARPWLAARYTTFTQSTANELMHASTEPQSKLNPVNLPQGPPTAGPGGYGKNLQKKNFSEDLPIYRLHCVSSRNNTITTLSFPDGKLVLTASGGSCGFKKANRSTYEAGYQCAMRMFKKLEEISKDKQILVELFFKGFGEGRQALRTALLSAEGNSIRDLFVRVTDRTPIKVGGTRSKKTRRL